MNVFSLLTDTELATMTSRAWRESVHCWQEYRESTTPQPFYDSAVSANEFWRDLVTERTRRDSL